MPKKEHRKAVGSPLSPAGSPERSCIVTREAKPKEALIRFVVSPDGMLVADLAGKLPGRGMYVSANKLLVGEAIAKKAFPRAAQQQVRLPDGFLEKLETQMLGRVLEALSMARKAGQVIAGFDKVEENLKRGKVLALLHAADAGDDGVRKLRNKAVADVEADDDWAESGAATAQSLSALLETLEDDIQSGPKSESEPAIPTYRFLSRELLSKALGRENAVHVAVTQGPAAAFFLAEARRFALFLQ